jgi:hypothetical protein
MGTDIVVRSHVSRDLLQSAALFKTDSQVIWEYVSNSLQYVDHGISPNVDVVVDSRRKAITISDNGRGMDWEDLRNFFIMHGENQDRKRGQTGRGNFGTGKSAAFGVADDLRITTIQNGRRSIVELSRNSLEKSRSGEPVPVKTVERETQTSESNGTMVEIKSVHLRGFDQAGIIKYIERHLAHARRDAAVFVNGHVCEYAEPPISHIVEVEAPTEYARMLGDVKLELKVSKVPLDADSRGVSIYSNGVWHESTLAGSDGKEMSQYIFGVLEVPRLEQDKSPIRPFDMSRSMKLNPSNQLVQTIYSFIGQSVEIERKKLVDAEKARRTSEEAKKLALQASQIADILNDDFAQFRNRFARAHANRRGQRDSIQASTLIDGSDVLVAGGDIASSETDDTIFLNPERGNGAVETPSDTTQTRLKADGGDKAGTPVGSAGEQAKAKGGGFQVKFGNLGAQVARARYEPDTRTIFVNLDHPQIVAALGISTIDEPAFMRLAYEVAFCEYAIALAQELARQGLYLDATDPIVDIRDSINRLATRAAELYRTG